MHELVRPGQVFLGLSAVMTFLGFFHVFFPEATLRWEGLDPSLLQNEVVNVLYRSYGLAMLTIGAAYCALHETPTQFSLRTMGAMHVISVVFSTWVATKENHHAVSGGLPAFWGLLHLLIAIYMLTAHLGKHRHHHVHVTAVPVAVPVVSVSPVRASASPARKPRGRSPRKAE